MIEGINRTTLKGELCENIKNALKLTFQNVYPGYEIEIQYITDRKSDNKRFFYVYLKGSTFNVNDEIPMLKDHLVFVDKFVNSDAILFSEYSRAEFEKENDCKEENMDIIREAIKNIQDEFKDEGKFTKVETHRNSYMIRFEVDVDVPNIHSLYREIEVSHYFKIVPISTNNAKAHASKIRKALKRGIERVKRECSRGY